MILLDYQDRRPIYEQVVEKFRILILSGALPPGERMPSVRQLAMELSINPNTIQRAYMELEQQSLIYPVKGRGNFVADSQSVLDAGISSLKQELSALVKKGKSMGVQEQELQEMLHNCYEEGNI